MSEKCLGFFFGYCVFGIVRRREMQWYYCVLEVFRIKEETSDYGLFVIRNTAYVRRLYKAKFKFIERIESKKILMYINAHVIGNRQLYVLM